MKRIALLLAFTLLPSPGMGLPGSPLETQTLRGVAVRESPVQAGLEEKLHWTPQDRWIPRKKIRDEMVAWRETSPPATIKGVHRALRRAGITWERYLLTRQLFETKETMQEGKFAGMPNSLDGQDESILQDDLIIAGRDRNLLKQFGVAIMAGGDGTRLVQKLIEMGLLPKDAFEKFTKPTLSVMPISGKSPLQMQMEVLAAINGKMRLQIPVAVVVNPDTEALVKKLLEENGNFGLKELRVVVQDVSPTLDEQGKLILRDDGLPALNPDGTGGVLRAIAKHGVFDWFRGRLGEQGRLFLVNGDMLVDEGFFYRVAAASKDRSILGVAYPYDPLKADRGIFVRVDRPGRGERLEIVETSHRKTIEGLQQKLEEMGRQNQKVLANSGLYVVSLAGIEVKITTLKPNARRGRDVARAKGIKGNKAEYYATDLFGEYEIKPEEVSILAVDEWRLAAMKDPEERKRMQGYAHSRGRAEALERGLEVQGGAEVEFHPGYKGTIGPSAKVRGKGTRVYFDRDRVWLKQGGHLELLRGKPDLPAGMVISSEGFVRKAASIPALGLDAAVGMEIGARESQQDTHGLILLPKAGKPRGVLAMVADGVGGTAAGEKASQMAVARARRLLSQRVVRNLLAEYGAAGPGKRKEELEQRVFPNLLEEAMVSTNADVSEAFEKKYPNLSYLQRPGSTLLLALATGRVAFTASVGDSRVYRFSKGELEQITPDDTLAWEMAQAEVQPAQVPQAQLNRVVSKLLREKIFPGSNALSQSIGMPGVPKVHEAAVPLEPGDWLVLVSDGVTRPVNEEKLSEVLAASDSAEAAMRRIMDLAQGGSDNQTVIVLRRTEVPVGPAGLEEMTQGEWLQRIGVSTEA